MFGDDMCEDMCVWRRYVSEYVCLATICVRICVFGLDIARDPVGWPTVPPISRCSEANVWSSRFDALESLRHDVECMGITASRGRTRSNARESLLCPTCHFQIRGGVQICGQTYVRPPNLPIPNPSHLSQIHHTCHFQIRGGIRGRYPNLLTTPIHRDRGG